MSETIEFQIDVMMYGSISVEINISEEIKVYVCLSDEMGSRKETEYVFDMMRYNKFSTRISTAVKQLSFEDDICELYGADNGITWCLKLSDGKSIYSSEKSELLYLIVDTIEECFPIRKKISKFLEF